jgi:hypothetical protein
LQIGVADESAAHCGVQFGGQAASLIDMVEHKAPHLFGVAPSRRREQTAMSRVVSVAEPLVGGMSWLIAQSHEVTQQPIDDLAHEAKQRIRVGCG